MTMTENPRSASKWQCVLRSFWGTTLRNAKRFLMQCVMFTIFDLQRFTPVDCRLERSEKTSQLPQMLSEEGKQFVPSSSGNVCIAMTRSAGMTFFLGRNE